MAVWLCLVWIVLLSLNAPPAFAQSTLPVVDEVDFAAFQTNGLRLLAALEQLREAVPATTLKQTRMLFQKGDQDPQTSVKAMQRLLDPHCLIGVNINPESRVKAARGPARADLKQGRDHYFLIKVANEAGVRHGLLLSSPQLRTANSNDAEHWLSATIETAPPLAKTLSGQQLEYMLLRLKTEAQGKREATLKFDVGQGTQDLGFRAEVPILFTIRGKE